MTLEDLKQLYASDQGYDGWDDLAICSTDDEYDQQWRNVCILAQKQALENAAGNAKQIDLNEGKCGGMLHPCLFIDEETITDESNLIR